jgi:hypothetical protein
MGAADLGMWIGAGDLTVIVRIHSQCWHGLEDGIEIIALAWKWKLRNSNTVTSVQASPR